MPWMVQLESVVKRFEALRLLDKVATCNNLASTVLDRDFLLLFSIMDHFTFTV